MSTIYRSPAGRQAIEQRYREYLTDWPVPAEHRTVGTRHGDTFVASCGPESAPPPVLLHGGRCCPTPATQSWTRVRPSKSS